MGGGTFNGCEKLTKVTIGNGVKSIKYYYEEYDPTHPILYGAFAFCSSLTSITIPNNVKSIGQAAFYSCKNLASVTIGNGVTEIELCAFDDCDSLTSVTFQSTILSKNFSEDTFPGDLRNKYLAKDGGPGTYKRFTGGTTWRKQ